MILELLLESNGPIDYVGVIEDIMYVTIGRSKDIILKGN